MDYSGVSIKCFENCSFTEPQFEMIVPNSNGTIPAVCFLSSQRQIHGRIVSPGNVVVRFLRILKQWLRPLCPGRHSMKTNLCVLVDSMNGPVPNLLQCKTVLDGSSDNEISMRFV